MNSGQRTVTSSEIAAGRAQLLEHRAIAILPRDFRIAMLDACRWLHVMPGDVVTRVGDPGDGIYGVATGAIGMLTALGIPDLTIGHIFGPGDWFGIDPIFTRLPRNATMSARLPGLLAHLPMAAIERLGSEYPEGWRHFGVLAIRGAQAATNLAADLMIPDSRRRCLATLLRLAGARFVTPERGPLLAPVNQLELGAIANLSRNSVNAILRQAAQDGLIDIGYGTITLRDADALRWIVDEA